MPTPHEVYQRYITTHLSYIYRGDVKEYEQYRRYFRANYQRFLPADRHASIVDVGCGLGHCLYYLQSEGYTQFVALDVCAEALEECIARGLVPRERAVQAEAGEYLEAHPHTFDVIIMNDVIEHITKEAVLPLLTSVRRALRPGGVAIIKTLNASQPLLGCGSRYIDFTHTLLFTEESLRYVCVKAGFAQTAIYPQNIWVFNPVVNVIGRMGHWMLGGLFRLLFVLYGRHSTHIFTKDIIAVARTTHGGSTMQSGHSAHQTG